jgi:uncharacterized protein DUF3501
MKSIDRDEILGLADYETVREPFRARVIAEKKYRRLPVGPRASAVFENRDTVLLQIQEMLRTERITRPAAVQHEIDTYNELVPGEGELSCTLMIEIGDKLERDAFLQAAKGLEKHVWLVAGVRRLAARASVREVPGSAEARSTSESWAQRTTAVHYLKFLLPKDVADALRQSGSVAMSTALALEIDHPAYAARTALPAEAIALLGEDLRS